MPQQQLRLAEFCSAAGINRETYRTHVAKGLLPWPERREPGRQMTYTTEHVDRLRLMVKLQEEGCSLELAARAVRQGIGLHLYALISRSAQEDSAA